MLIIKIIDRCINCDGRDDQKDYKTLNSFIIILAIKYKKKKKKNQARSLLNLV